MPKKHDLPKRQADRKMPWGGSNLVWSMIAVGVAGLFAMSLLTTTPELELSYSDLEKLIRASGQRPPAPTETAPSPAPSSPDGEAGPGTGDTPPSSAAGERG